MSVGSDGLLSYGLGFDSKSLPLANSSNERRSSGSSWGVNSGGLVSGGDEIGRNRYALENLDFPLMKHVF
jgi:hypothetical protein